MGFYGPAVNAEKKLAKLRDEARTWASTVQL
jgi:hypothetical protein